MIKSLGCSRELTEKNGRATGEAALSTHIHVYTSVMINQHTCTLPASTIPWHILPMLSLRVEPIWFAIDLEDDSSSADAYHVMTSVFEVGGKRVEASIFINT